MSSPSTPLRIAIFGPGNIGSTIALHLSRASHHITTISRSSSTRLAQLQASHAITTTTAGPSAPVTPTSDLESSLPFDLIVITLSSHHITPSVLASVNAHPTRKVLCMFNTFVPEAIDAALPGKDVVFSLPFLHASLTPSGHLIAKVTGVGTQPTLIGDESIVSLFRSAGLPANHEPNMRLWLRCHAPFCVAFESIAVCGQRRGGGASWREAKVRAEGVRNGFALIRALGFDVYPGLKRGAEKCPVVIVAAVLWLLSRIQGFREILAQGADECEAIVGQMVEAAGGLKGQDVDVEAIRRTISWRR